jgi:DNA-binding MarR family transcriptional regulator
MALAQLCRANRQYIDEELRKIGLHVGQEMILFQLWCEEDGLSQSQFAEKLCVEPPTVTKMLQRMEAVQLVVRRPDPDDARISRVFLTEKGRALEGPVKKIWEELDTRSMAGLSLPEQMLLRRMLLQIHENLTK